MLDREWEVYKKFYRKSLKERDRLEDLGIDGIFLMKWIFENKYYKKMRRGLDRHRTSSDDVLLWAGKLTFEFRKRAEILDQLRNNKNAEKQ